MDETPVADNDANLYGEVCWRKERRKRQKLLVIEVLYEYAKSSTLHGLRYIVERGLESVEKCFWLFTFLMSVAMCFYLISNVWIKWRTSPVIVTFSERIVPVSDVPFPSVTICPQIKSKATIFNYTDEYLKYKEGISNWTEKLDNIAFICDKKTLEDIRGRDRNYTDTSFIDNLYEVAPEKHEVIVSCQWRGQHDCMSYLNPVLTSEGVCYNFNALAASQIFRKDRLQDTYKYLNKTRLSVDWSLTDGSYTDFRPRETYPLRGRENNAKPDLDLILMETPEYSDGFCNRAKSGFTIYVQHPSDLPQASLYYYAALSGQTSSLAVKFNMVTTAADLKTYSPDVRQCYFPSERELRYFQIYTANNCRLECQSNYTFARCGCVNFHMPHDSRRICTSRRSIMCMEEALDKLSLAEIKHKATKSKTRSCHCLPSCKSVTYDAEILKTAFDIQSQLEAYENLNYNFSFYKTKNLSRVEMYFKEPRFVSMHRSELFGVTDFLANCGGLLGLFLGFSFLSLVEIVYFGTLRLFYILRRDLREEKENEKKEAIQKF